MGNKSGINTEVSFEDCLQISTKDLGKELRKKRLSLGQMVSLWESGKIKEVSGTMNWTKTSRSTGETRKLAEIGYSMGTDSRGVYLELAYSLSQSRENKRYRYYLIAKESNLKPGTYRYYFGDPYSGKDPGLCTKLYLYNGVFYPRSVLQSYGVLYKQQREGHTRRYVWTFYSRVPRWEDMKRRKSHYRGKETPVWRRYNYLCEEGDYRLVEYLVKKEPEMYQEYADMIRSVWI